MPDYLGDEVRRLRTVEAGAMRLAVGAGYREARRSTSPRHGRKGDGTLTGDDRKRGRLGASAARVGQARLPILEHTDVFEKPLGPTSDVVNKEMYTFQPPGSDDRLTLRPEGTAGAPLRPTSLVVRVCCPSLPQARARTRAGELESAPTGLMRALIARGMTGPGPAQKWFYCGPMFRHERPQKGRLRQV